MKLIFVLMVYFRIENDLYDLSRYFGFQSLLLEQTQTTTTKILFCLPQQGVIIETRCNKIYNIFFVNKLPIFS